MVLAELGKRLQTTLRSLSTATVIDQAFLDQILKEVCAALLHSDVNVKLVQKLRTNIKKIVDLDKLEGAANKKRMIHKAIFDELCLLVDPQVEQFVPKKGKSNVIMFVGLQGSGKTAGAFDQLKQNATKAKIPYFGSYSESDPVALALEGVEKFKKEHFEIIIVDTSGRHRQETELFAEMKQISDVINPDNVIFVLDGTIGQAADLHARAFKETVDIGSIIITKMDGHAKGGGAISAVAATGSPIVFIATGEHIHDLEVFNAQSFVNKMLGMGDLRGLMETLQDTKIDKEGLMKNIAAGKFTFRDMKGQFEMISGMGPMSKIMGMIPGMPAGLANAALDEHGGNKLKHYTCIMDSMTEQELDSDYKLFRSQPSRIYRVARGSGVVVQEVEELLTQHEAMGGMVKSMGGPNGLLANMARNQPRPGQQMPNMQDMMSQMMGGGGMGDMMSNMMNAMGGAGGMQEMMSKMMSGGGLGDMMSNMMNAMGGAGGMGMPGMPGMPGMGMPRPPVQSTPSPAPTSAPPKTVKKKKK
ncbi:Signal recognition particle [Boothiomyces macroporosus]|uniref:signal-recognition-particle GTPase n=1 Tax=Boothiomyces macroporosus TaxID=261099 RepID=A0AAD5UF90_9FUNG|nr:Signal recognition particle [Boothiomyces macroporosus]